MGNSYALPRREKNPSSSFKSVKVSPSRVFAENGSLEHLTPTQIKKLELTWHHIVNSNPPQIQQMSQQASEFSGCDSHQTSDINKCTTTMDRFHFEFFSELSIQIPVSPPVFILHLCFLKIKICFPFD